MKDALIQLFTSEIIAPLVTALGHSLWQSALAALLLFAVFAKLGSHRPAARYTAALIALATSVAAFLLTFALLRTEPALPADIFTPAPIASAPAETAPLPAAPIAISPLPTPTQANWEPIIFAIWLAGVTCFLLRTARSYHALGKLRRSAEPITSPALKKILATVQNQLGCLRPVVLLQCEKLGSPAVAGFLRPAIFLPAAMVTGCDETTLRAVLAHEIAHLRRHDYLVNLAQMVIEALFFFSPAIWYISRQLRNEREAACDQLAANTCGSPQTYAASLLAWVESNSPVPKTALAASGHHPTGLASRLHRLLGKTTPRVSTPALITCAALALLGLFATRATANADEWKTALNSLRSNFIEEDKPDAPLLETQIVGRVFTPNGNSPNPADSSEYEIILHRHNGSHHFEYTYNEFIHPGKFRYSPNHPVQAFVWFKGYAPHLSEPFIIPANTERYNLNVTIDKGFPYHIEITSDKGTPIKGARVTYEYYHRQDHTIPLITDASGHCTIKRVNDVKMRVHVLADGFQQASTQILSPEPGGSFRITLQPAAHASVTITDNGTGLAIPGSTIRIFGSTPQGVQIDRDTVIASSDAQGTAFLTSLAPGSEYTLAIQADGYRGQIFEHLRPGDAIQIRLNKLSKFTLRISIPQSIRKLKKDPILFDYKMHYQAVTGKSGSYTNGLWSERTRLPLDRPTIDWVITPPWERQYPKFAKIYPHYRHNQYAEEVYPPMPDESGIIFVTLPEHESEGTKQLKEQEVILKAKFLDPVMEKDFILPFGIQSDGDYSKKTIQFTDGKASFTVIAPAKIRATRSTRVESPDSWFDIRYLSQDIPASEAPQVIDLGTIYPTGAVAAALDASLLKQFGQPNADQFTLETCDSVASDWNERPPDFRRYEAMPEKGNTGRFLFPPLPLGRTYYVLYQSGNTIIEGAKFMLTEQNPLYYAVFSSVRTDSLQLHIPDDIPPDINLNSLKFYYKSANGWRPAPGQSASYRLDSLRDFELGDGLLTFQGVNWNNPGEYWLEFRPQRHFKAVKIPFPKKPNGIVEGLFYPLAKKEKGAKK